MLKFTIPIDPKTKKNHSQMIKVRGHMRLIPSKAFTQYQKDIAPYVPKVTTPICWPVNLKATFYTSTRRRCDLVNLIQALQDALVHYKVLEDDNRNIIVSLDGCRVCTDKDRPRTEVEITEVERNG